MKKYLPPEVALAVNATSVTSVERSETTGVYCIVSSV